MNVILYNHLRIDAFSKLHRSLREFGMKLMTFIEEQVPSQDSLWHSDLANTVKPVLRGHLWDKDKVAL